MYKIVLYNLNTYIGGGETLLIRFALYLKKSNMPYVILCRKDSYIMDAARKYSLNMMLWPSKNDAFIYDKSDVEETIQSLPQRLIKESIFFSFCMRDLTNLLILSLHSELNFRVFHGVYHPYDFRYLSSLNSKWKLYQNNYKSLLLKLHESRSVLFMNEKGFRSSIEVDATIKEPIIHPIPISIERSNAFPKDTPLEHVVICISRFTVGKIGAVISFLRLAKSSKHDRFILIGNGSFIWLVEAYRKFWKLKNLDLCTDVTPDDLKNQISRATIGYAQGTSILEIAKYHKPVLIAPYSTLRDILNVKFSSPGIFKIDGGSADFGDYTVSDHGNFVPLLKQLEQVKSEYHHYAELSHTAATEYDADKIFSAMVNDIQSGQAMSKSLTCHVPQAPFLKWCVKLILRMLK